MGLFISTTGTNVSIPELGITFVNPTSLFQVDLQFSSDEVRAATSLTTAINSGSLAWRKVGSGAAEVPSSYDPDFLNTEQEALGPGDPLDVSPRWRDFNALEAFESANTTKNNNTFSQMGGMTITPPEAGSYQVLFSTSLSSSSNTGVCEIVLYVGGTAAPNSARTFQPRNSNSSNVTIGAFTNAQVTVDGSQSIIVYWRMSSGTITAQERTLNVWRVK